jgi:hypothetical protein
MHSLDHVKSIVYKLNEFQRASLSAIRPFILRRKPMNLEELRIVNCKIGPSITHDLISELMDGTVAKLSLVKANMSYSSFYTLCDFVGKTRHLRELDISNNDLPMNLMVHFVSEVLSKDRQLVSCNISNNRLMPVTKTVIPSLIPEKDGNGNVHKGKPPKSSLRNLSRMSREEYEDKD